MWFLQCTWHFSCFLLVVCRSYIRKQSLGIFVSNWQCKFWWRFCIVTEEKTKFGFKVLVCCKPPINVPYKRTFGAPDQGQMREVWESQITQSALRWLAPYCLMSYSWRCFGSYSWSHSWTHMLGIKTMTSLILDHVAMDFLYLGTSTERKLCSWNCPGTQSW